MIFSEELKNNINNIQSIYDLAALCYTYLNKNIDNQIIFIGSYIETNQNSQKTNPNLSKLNSLSYNLFVILSEEYLGGFYDDELKQKIIDIVISTESKLQEYEDDFLNNAVIPFFIINGIELYIKGKSFEVPSMEPLNKLHDDFCYVYTNNCSSFMDCIMTEKDYPNLIERTEIKSRFECIIFFDVKKAQNTYGVPKLTTIQKCEKYIDEIVNSNKIKIISIPISNTAWFKEQYEQGATFSIKYDKGKEQEIENRVIRLLESAIDSKANIIVFPEFMCSEQIQHAISQKLSQIKKDNPIKLRNLLFVVAGSAWTDDSNNVCVLYNYDGYELGKMYKYSAYDNTKKDDKPTSRYLERLMNPGKEITLIKIPGIGIFQFDICRDISENEFCLELVKTFRPQFVIIPAYSSSINIGFKQQISSFISVTHKTCSVVCNCCAAVPNKNKYPNRISIAAVPHKENSIIESNTKYINRDIEKCNNLCRHGCIIEITYTFNPKAEKEVNLRISKPKYKKALENPRHK